MTREKHEEIVYAGSRSSAKIPEAFRVMQDYVFDFSRSAFSRSVWGQRDAGYLMRLRHITLGPLVGERTDFTRGKSEHMNHLKLPQVDLHGNLRNPPRKPRFPLANGARKIVTKMIKKVFWRWLKVIVSGFRSFLVLVLTLLLKVISKNKNFKWSLQGKVTGLCLPPLPSPNNVTFSS